MFRASAGTKSNRSRAFELHRCGLAFSNSSGPSVAVAGERTRANQNEEWEYDSAVFIVPSLV